MRITTGGWLLLVVFVPIAAFTQEVGTTPTPDELYPLKVGNKWKLTMEQDGVELRLFLVVAKKETIDGTEMFRVETRMDDRLLATEHLSSSTDGIFRHRFNGAELSPPLKLLPNPLTLDDQWKQTINLGGEVIKTTCKLGKAVEIDVSAGSFKAYELTVEGLTAANANVVSNFWLVPNVGIVMQDMLIDGKEVFTAELTKFEPAVDDSKPADAVSKP